MLTDSKLHLLPSRYATFKGQNYDENVGVVQDAGIL